MKLWLKCALAGVAALGVGAAALATSKAKSTAERLEADFQTTADAKRVNDVHKIAELLEEHRARTGLLPFEARMPANSVLTVLVAPPKAEREIATRGNPLGPEPPSAYADDLLGEMRAAKGPALLLPVDPQRGATGAPNAYYVRFKPGGQYLVAAFLRRPRANTTVLAPGVYAYALRSKVGAWRGDIWPGARTLEQVSPEERAWIGTLGAHADAQFRKYMQIATTGKKGPSPAQ